MIVAPGSVIGIIGGGQLGRMLCVAAAQLGYNCHVFAPDADAPAAAVAARFTQGAWDDEAAIRAFAAQADILTFEFENIDTGVLLSIADGGKLLPHPRSLAVAQDRLAEKNFAREHGLTPARFAPVDDEQSLKRALGEVGFPAILKTRRFGYDGKGQQRIIAAAEAEPAWRALGGAPAILEALVPFAAEFSILLCRAASGETVFWDAPVNRHHDGILERCDIPADPSLAPLIADAQGQAARLAQAIDHVGMLAVEFFAATEGPVFNEMAPRVHNSGHWTIEGSLTSQFENHVRAICGLPLGATARTAPRVEMLNLIGGEADGWAEILADPGAKLHLYGKGEGRPGRKMGHVTRLIA